MSKKEEMLEKLTPLLKELICEMKKEKLPCIQAITIEEYEVLIKKQDFEIPDFPPPKCEECGYQMTYDDWDEREYHTYFCPDCGMPVER